MDAYMYQSVYSGVVCTHEGEQIKITINVPSSVQTEQQAPPYEQHCPCVGSWTPCKPPLCHYPDISNDMTLRDRDLTSSGQCISGHLAACIEREMNESLGTSENVKQTPPQCSVKNFFSLLLEGVLSSLSRVHQIQFIEGCFAAHALAWQTITVSVCFSFIPKWGKS